MPKSGSTFLSNAVAQAGGLRKISFVPDHDRREQELCEHKLSRRKFQNIIAQHHVRYSRHTASIIEKFDLKTVVLVRDLFDAAISLRDHIHRESAIMPMGYFREQDVRKPHGELEVMIARSAMPWYLNFYMSWRDVPGVLLMDYSEISSDPAGAVQKVLEFSGRPVSRARVEQTIASLDMNALRFNKGIANRGAHINSEAREVIRRLIAQYDPGSDPYLAGMLADT